MYKTVGIYKNITDSKEFEKYYIEAIFPKMITFPGVVKMKITNLIDNTRKIPPGMEGIQFIIETHYESIQDLRKIVDTEEGQDIVKTILGNQHAECGRYIGESKSFLSKEMQNKPTGSR
jgi:hypothetical protein